MNYKKKYLLFMITLIAIVTFFYDNSNIYKPEAKTQENLEEMYIPDKLKDYIQEVRCEKIVIPNIKGIYNFLYVADTHVIIKSRDELGGWGNTDKRIDDFRNNKGKSSAEQFPYWIELANKTNVNALLMGGDIIDYLSIENVNYVKSNLNDLKCPYLYTMGNHDSYIPWNNVGFVNNNKNLLSLFRNGDIEVQTLDCGEFNIVSVNDAVNDNEAGLPKISPKALGEFKEVYKTGKPIILIMHIPLCTKNTDMLKKDTIKAWGKYLLLGEDGSYDLDDNTKEFINMVTDNNSPIVGILAGHLHFYHKDLLNNKVFQLITGLSAIGNGIMITVQGNN